MDPRNFAIKIIEQYANGYVDQDLAFTQLISRLETQFHGLVDNASALPEVINAAMSRSEIHYYLRYFLTRNLHRRMLSDRHDCTQRLLQIRLESQEALHYKNYIQSMDTYIEVLAQQQHQGLTNQPNQDGCCGGHDSDNHIIDLTGTGVGSGLIDLTGNGGGGDFGICDGCFEQCRDDGDTDLLWNSLREITNGQDPSVLLSLDIGDGVTINNQST